MIYNSYDKQGLVKILSLLKSHHNEYLSGQDLSEVLEISRVAVWKYIRQIRALGYKVDSKKNRGYMLVKNTEFLLPWEIKEGLKTKLIGKRAYYFDSIDSTQNFAKKIASDSKENGTVIIARKQTRGKGRLNRKWVSPKGGIWLSIIFHPKFETSLATLFPIASSLALSVTIEKCFKKKPKLKWPNDIVLDGKKLAGLLVDLTVQSNKIENLILGVGINYNVDTKKIEKNLKDSRNFYGAASLDNNKTKINQIKFIQTFLYELEKTFDFLNNERARYIINRWTKRSNTIGKRITVMTSEGPVKGKAIKLDQDGALVIKQNSKTRRILVGDIGF